MNPNPPIHDGRERCHRFHEPPPLGVYLVFLGHRLSYLMGRRLAPHDLNRTQAMIIMALRRRPGTMALDLAGPLWVEPPSVTRAIQSLERRGLVVRQAHPTDGRASLFYLTPAGEAVAAAIDRVARLANDELEAALSPEQRDSLRAALDTLAARIEALWDDSGAETASPVEPAGAAGGNPSKGLDR